jgi:hypothetical protein
MMTPKFDWAKNGILHKFPPYRTFQSTNSQVRDRVRLRTGLNAFRRRQKTTDDSSTDDNKPGHRTWPTRKTDRQSGDLCPQVVKEAVDTDSDTGGVYDSTDEFE